VGFDFFRECAVAGNKRMIGLLERAAAKQLVDLPETIEALRRTNARIDADLIRIALERARAKSGSH
jgi:hypothetical protein